MNKRLIVCFLGNMLKIEGLLMFIPFLIGLIYSESQGYAFLLWGILSIALGFVFTIKKPRNENLYAKDGFILVALGWVISSVVGALPFVINKDIPRFVDAFFEMVSGFTTTGSSILTDVEALSHASLFWRSFAHWIGGMGILVFVIAFIPIASNRSLHIFRAEMPGPIVGKLVSKAKLTAQILYIIYMVLTIIEIFFLLAGKMSLFDSVLTAFGTAGTGGFGIKNSSIAFYDSAYIDGVITVFMIIFGINFNVIYLYLLRKFKVAFSNEEVRWYLVIIFGAAILISINILPMYGTFMHAFRYAIFQVASIITTTGYVTTNYDLWPQFSKSILFILMFVGACAGSTGGGMKVSRIMIFVKHAKQELKKLVHPNSVSTVEIDHALIDNKTMSNIHAYLVSYTLIFVASFMVLSFFNLDFESGISAVTTCLNNVGPGFNVVGPVSNFASLPDLSKLVLSFDMLAGRLEVFPMLLLFSPQIWRNK